jgi:hypothetical protein
MLVYDIVLRMGKQRVSMTAAELQAAGRAVRLTGGPRWPAAGVFRWGPRGYLTPCSGGPAWAGGWGENRGRRGRCSSARARFLRCFAE